MKSDGTMRCGVNGCKCTRYKEKPPKVGVYEDRCVCGHTKINHVLNTPF